MQTHRFLAAPLMLLAIAMLSAADTPSITPGADPQSGERRVVNRIDPVNGKPVVNSVEPVSIQVMHKVMPGSGGAGIVGAEMVPIGFSEQASRQQVQQADGKMKEQFALAAKQNRIMKDGEIMDGSDKGIRADESGTPSRPNQRQDTLPGTGPGNDRRGSDGGTGGSTAP